MTLPRFLGNLNATAPSAPPAGPPVSSSVPAVSSPRGDAEPHLVDRRVPWNVGRSDTHDTHGTALLGALVVAIVAGALVVLGCPVGREERNGKKWYIVFPPEVMSHMVLFFGGCVHVWFMQALEPNRSPRQPGDESVDRVVQVG